MSGVGWAERKGHKIEDEDVKIRDRRDLDFVGAGVTVTDAGGETVVTIPGGGGGPLADHAHAGVAGDGNVFDAANLSSGVADDGQILTADGAGNAAWEDPVVSGITTFFFYNDASADPATYKQMLPAHSTGIEDTISVAGLVNTGIIEEFITNVGSPNADFLLSGMYLVHIHALKSAGTQALRLYAEIYRRTFPGGVETLLGTTQQSAALNGVETEYTLHAAINDTDIDLTDRLVVKIRAGVTGGGTAPTAELHVEGDTYSHFEAPVLYNPATVPAHDHSGDAGDGGTFDAANLTSGASTDGQILMSDGAAGAAWEDAGNASPIATGWMAAGETWTYASADDPTFTFTIAGDKTGKYSAGMRLKLTQTTDKYFIVTGVSYGAPNTTVTIYGGTDYDLANAAITNPYFSIAKSPFGFPLDPIKWSVKATDTNDLTQADPVQNTWYNAISISIPIGCWEISYRAHGYVGDTAGMQNRGALTLSTGNDSETDKEFNCSFGNINSHASATVDHDVTLFTKKHLNLDAKTAYYLNYRTTNTSMNIVGVLGSTTTTIITAVCAYL